MPDLSHSSIHAFWDSYDRRTLYRVVMALERVEHWALDHLPQVEQPLLKLGKQVDRVGGNFEIQDIDHLIRVLSQIKVPKAMRLLHALDVNKAGTASKVLVHAEEVGDEKKAKTNNPHAKLFLRRNLVFERLQLLTRVFTQQRLGIVLKALELYNDETEFN